MIRELEDLRRPAGTPGSRSRRPRLSTRFTRRPQRSWAWRCRTGASSPCPACAPRPTRTARSCPASGAARPTAGPSWARRGRGSSSSTTSPTCWRAASSLRLVGQAPAPAARGGAPGPADSGAADKEEKLDPKSPEAMTKKIKNTLDEYVSVGDAAEALMCIKELGAPNSFLPKVVEMIVEKILDNAKPREKELLTKLALATVQRGALTLDMFLEGYKTHSDQLEDSMLDIPLAPTLLGDFFCTSVSDKVLDFSHLAGICEKIEGGEPRRALVGAILKRFRSLKGEVYVTEACKGAKLPLVGAILKRFRSLKGEVYVT